MNKLLITGAYGLMGSAICRVLEELYPHVEVTKVKFDDLPYGDFQEYDYIIHAAGYGQPMKFTKQKVETLMVNTTITERLMRYFFKPDGKFLYVSTSEVYSGATPPYKEEQIGTTTPQHPRACYIEGKRCGEAVCMAYREQGFDVKIARLALAYGPGTKVGDTRVINQLIEQALVHKRIHLLDKGEAVRTYVYVDDAARMMVNILMNGKSTVYNVGGEDTMTVKQLADKIAAIVGVKVVPGEASLEGAPQEVKLDMTKTIREMRPVFTQFSEGLLRTIEYQKKLYE